MMMMMMMMVMVMVVVVVVMMMIEDIHERPFKVGGSSSSDAVEPHQFDQHE
jgi:uncharacterized membrane protein